MRLQAMHPPDALHRADADPVQWAASAGGPAKVKATTRSAILGPRAEFAPAASCHARVRRCLRRQTVLAIIRQGPAPKSRPPVRSLEPISKPFEEDHETCKLDKAEEIVGVVLPANEDPALPLNPGEEALNEPASHVAA